MLFIAKISSAVVGAMSLVSTELQSAGVLMGFRPGLRVAGARVGPVSWLWEMKPILHGPVQV